MYMDIVVIRSEIGSVIGGHGGHPVGTSRGMLPLGALKLAQEASMAALLTIFWSLKFTQQAKKYSKELKSTER